MDILINSNLMLLLLFSRYKRLAVIGVGEQKVVMITGYVKLIALFINT
jgi:hypothetical protein